MDVSPLSPLLRRHAGPSGQDRLAAPSSPARVTPLSLVEAKAARQGAIDGKAVLGGPRLQRGWAAALFCVLLTVAPAVRANAQEADLPAAGEAATVSPATVTTVHDPFERVNRATFKFNSGADRYVMGPVSRGYATVTPRIVRNRIGALLGNLGEPFTAVNDVLQVRGRDAGRTTSRFLINSTLGGLGLFDVASRFGIDGHESDFGQTLGRYGVGGGPYVVLPLLGPSSIRDSVGGIVESVADPVSVATAGVGSFGLIRGTSEAIDGRAAMEPMMQALKQAPDPYATVRASYVEGRAAMVRAARGEVESRADLEASTNR